MRHAISGNKLNRNSAWRKATVRDIAKATLVRQRVCTTKAKAKEARKMVDKLITLGKKGTLADRRRAFAVLCDHKIVSDLFSKTAPRFKNRVGGYTRIIPLWARRGDNAQLAYLELTEKEEVIVSKPKTKAKAKKSKLKPQEPQAQEAAQPTKVEAKPKKQPKAEKAQVVPEKEVAAEPKKKEKPVKSKETPKAEKKQPVKEGKPKKPEKFAGLKKFFRRKSS